MVQCLVSFKTTMTQVVETAVVPPTTAFLKTILTGIIIPDKHSWYIWEPNLTNFFKIYGCFWLYANSDHAKQITDTPGFKPFTMLAKSHDHSFHLNFHNVIMTSRQIAFQGVPYKTRWRSSEGLSVELVLNIMPYVIIIKMMHIYIKSFIWIEIIINKLNANNYYLLGTTNWTLTPNIRGNSKCTWVNLF